MPDNLKYRRRPDPMRRASLAAEVNHLQARCNALLRDRREAELHLKSCLDETERLEREATLDLAQLAALNADAQEFGGSLPDPEAERERTALEARLGRPGKIARSLKAEVERTSSELTEARKRLERAQQDLAALETEEKEFDAYELQQLRERAATNQVLSPQEEARLAAAGR